MPRDTPCYFALWACHSCVTTPVNTGLLEQSQGTDSVSRLHRWGRPWDPVEMLTFYQGQYRFIDSRGKYWWKLRRSIFAPKAKESSQWPPKLKSVYSRLSSRMNSLWHGLRYHFVRLSRALESNINICTTCSKSFLCHHESASPSARCVKVLLSPLNSWILGFKKRLIILPRPQRHSIRHKDALV